MVSITTASSACTSGDVARVRSIRSRSASAVATSGIAAVPPARGVRGVGRPPPRALFRRRVEKDLHVGGREHDRPDVAPFHHDAALAAERALPRDERLAHARLPRDDRRRRVHLRRADRGRDVVAVDANAPVADLEPGPRGQRRDGRFVRRDRSRRGAPSTPARGTWRRCRCGGSRAAPPARGRWCLCRRRTGRRWR